MEAYWGDPEKMRFKSTIDSFDDAKAKLVIQKD